MRRIILAAVTVAAIAGLAACSGSSTADLTAKNWQLTAMSEQTPAFQAVVPAAEQARYTITFNTDGTFSALADCNRVVGTYTTTASKMTIAPGPTTLMACPAGSLSDLYLHALAAAASYAIANGQLTITLGGGGTLTFVAGPPDSASPSAAASAAPAASPAAVGSPDPALLGKAWQLTSITEMRPASQSVVPDADQSRYTIEFKPDGSYAARADCNQVVGTYRTTAAGGMTITLGPSTMAACPEGSLADLYLVGLSNAASYAIASDVLTITLTDTGSLTFK